MPTIELYNTVLDAWACAALFKTQTQEQNQQHQNHSKNNIIKSNKSAIFCRQFSSQKYYPSALRKLKTALQPTASLTWCCIACRTEEP
jgi:hypothetical protein